MNILVDHKVENFPVDWVKLNNCYTNSSVGI